MCGSVSVYRALWACVGPGVWWELRPFIALSCRWQGAPPACQPRGAVVRWGAGAGGGARFEWLTPFGLGRSPVVRSL